MPLQINITQPSGAVATYHVVMNCTANFIEGSSNNASVVINNYLSQPAFAAGDAPLGSLIQYDVSPIVNTTISSAISWQYIIEQYLLTTSTFSGATQVS